MSCDGAGAGRSAAACGRVSTQVSIVGVDGDFCAFPAVADVVNVAADGISLGAVPGTGSDSTSLGDGLAEAWRYCVSLATQHFPDVLGWLANVRLEEVDQFVPLAYEACGSWGQHAGDFFNFVKRCAGTEGTRAAEFYHWSAMTFGGHWRRRMAVEIGRGRVACLRRSGDRGFEGNSPSEAETAFLVNRSS